MIKLPEYICLAIRFIGRSLILVYVIAVLTKIAFDGDFMRWGVTSAIVGMKHSPNVLVAALGMTLILVIIFMLIVGVGLLFRWVMGRDYWDKIT